MNKNQILIISVALAALASSILYLGSSSSLGQVVSVLVLILALLMGSLAFVTPNISRVAWLMFALILLAASVAFGYVALTMNFPFGTGSFNPDTLGEALLLIELSIVISSLFTTYSRYTLQFKKAGYDESEFTQELGAFSKTVVMIAAGSAVVAGGVYFFLQLLPELQLDSLSVLVIATLIYFAIARYVLRAGRRETEVQQRNSV